MKVQSSTYLFLSTQSDQLLSLELYLNCREVLFTTSHKYSFMPWKNMYVLGKMVNVLVNKREAHILLNNKYYQYKQ